MVMVMLMMRDERGREVKRRDEEIKVSQGKRVQGKVVWRQLCTVRSTVPGEREREREGRTEEHRQTRRRKGPVREEAGYSSSCSWS